MAPALDSLDVTLNAIMARVEKSEKDLNETHARLRETFSLLDTLHLRSDDSRIRIANIEEATRQATDRHYEIAVKVDLLENKLDDMRSNLTKVVEGQISILNSNAATREQFSTVLATQANQHNARMKKVRTMIAVGGGFLVLASQVYAKIVGNETIIDMIMNFMRGPAG